MRRIQILKEFTAQVLWLTMLPVIVRELFQRNRVTIITYHRISPLLFEKHMTYLLKHYSIIPLHEFVEAKYNNNLKRLPKKAVIITFDDGNKVTYALKDIIQKYNIPVTVFICSDILGTKRHFWFSYINKIKTNLKRIPDAERLILLSSVGFYEERDYDFADSISLDEALDLLKIGISLQSHTATHPILPMCDSDKVKNEIGKSKKDIENKLGIEVTCLAYPNGDYCPRDIDLCRQFGYMAAVTMDPGFNNAGTNVYRLKRLSVEEHSSVKQFKVKVSGVWNMAKVMVFDWRWFKSTNFTRYEVKRRNGKQITQDTTNDVVKIYSGSRKESQ